MGEVIKLKVATSEEVISLKSASGSLAVEAVSPRVEFERTTNGSWMNVTDVDGEKTTFIPDGVAGPTGPAGETGPQGDPGPQGVGIKRVWWSNYSLNIELTDGTVCLPYYLRGEKGEQGDNGTDGVTFTPSVSSDGTLSWTNDGGRQNPLSVNIKGPQGPQGMQGLRGPGIVGVELLSDYTLKIIYQGGGYDIVGPIRGPQGEIGNDGSPGADGTTFTPSVSSEGVLSWTNDGGKTNPQSVNIRGPQGLPGSDATVTVDDALSDTSENPVQNKVITAEVLDIRDVLVNAGFVVVEDPCDWAVGNWGTSTGNAGNNSKRMRSTSATQITDFDYYIRSDTGVLFQVLYYNGSTFVPKTVHPWVSEYSIAANAPSGATGFRLNVRTDPETTMTDLVDATAAKIHFFRGAKVDVDQGVSNAGKALLVGSDGMVAPGNIYTPVTETVSGTDPVITGVADHRYVCGTCDTLTLTPPSSGIVDVVFTSGTTPTVLSVPNTVKWPGWFNPSALEASATYEINILYGTLGMVGIWT